jgi:hypothetical protein
LSGQIKYNFMDSETLMNILEDRDAKVVIKCKDKFVEITDWSTESLDKDLIPDALGECCVVLIPKEG